MNENQVKKIEIMSIIQMIVMAAIAIPLIIIFIAGILVLWSFALGLCVQGWRSFNGF